MEWDDILTLAEDVMRRKLFQNTERALESFSKPPLSLFHIYTLTHTHGVYELSVLSKPTDSLLVQLKLPKYLAYVVEFYFEKLD